MEPSEKLKKEWNAIMEGMLKVCRAQKGWKVKVLESMEIQVDTDFVIRTCFINNEYLEVYVIYKGEEYIKVRHIDRYDTTAHPIINFICFNR